MEGDTMMWSSAAEGLACEDPGDAADRRAHGFTYDDPFDTGLLCRNGCGLTYREIVGGKMRICRADTHAATAAVEAAEAAIWATITGAPRPSLST